MKVLYLITKSERGGAQVHVLDLVRALRGRIEPVVACGDDGFLLDECRKLGIETHVVPQLVHPMRPVQDAQAVAAVAKLIRQLNVDVIHGHTAKAGLIARLAGWIANTPALYTVHSWSFVGTGKLTGFVALGLERALRLAGGTVIEVCRSNFELARRRGVVQAARHLTIWNGMPDTGERARAKSEGTLRLLMAARFVSQKDQGCLLRALSDLKHHSWELTLAGGGPLQAQTQALSRELGIAERVTFTGDTDQVPAMLATSDIFVLASLYESLPLSIIEAMRTGLPVIATNVGGIAELVADGVTGFLVERGNPESLREKLADLMSSPTLRKRMGQAGRLRFERHFTVETMAGNVLALYREHCAAPGDRSLNLQTTGVAS